MTAYLRRPRQIRSAFTVVELLVVITVIAILTAILVPVVGSAYKRANEFAIQNEMSQLDQAIEQFKIKYGFYPPSFISITQPQDLLPYLNRIAPNHNEGNGGPGTNLEMWWNTVGVNIDPTKGEDLVFWLTGIAKNKQYPLTGNVPAADWLAYNGVSVNGITVERDSFIDMKTDRLAIDADARTAGYYQARGPKIPYQYIDAPNYMDTTASPAVPRAYGRPDPVNPSQFNFENPDSFQLVAWGLDGLPGNPGNIATVGTGGLDNIVNFIGDGSGRLESKVIGTQ